MPKPKEKLQKSRLELGIYAEILAKEKKKLEGAFRDFIILWRKLSLQNTHFHTANPNDFITSKLRTTERFINKKL